MEDKELIVVFSKEQLLKNKALYEKMGEKMPKKYVYINGKAVQYTDLLDSEDRIIYSDTKILIKDNESKLKLFER